MKNYILLLALFFGAYVVEAQDISKCAPQVVLIGVGEKNATLDESDFSDLKFYYTPGIKPVRDDVGETAQSLVNLTGGVSFVLEGLPEFLVNVNKKNELDEAFFLFDKNGVCETQGYDLMRQNGDIAKRICSDKKKLKDHLVDVVKKGKTAKKSKKELKIKKGDFMVGHSFPEFEVSDASGQSVSILSVLNNEPTLVVFFYLPPDIDIHAGENSFEDKSGKSFFKAMASSASGANDVVVFKNIQSQFFGNKDN